MAASAPSSPAGNVLSVMFLTACTLGGLLLLELGIWYELRPYAIALWQLQHLPERQIGDDFSGPAVLHGHLETTALRRSPSGTPSVVYYAWVEDHYRSGRSTSVRVLCNVGEDEDLTFRQGRRTLPFALFHHDEHIELLKRDGYLDSLRMQPKVAIDLGPVVSQKPVPEEMQKRCNSVLYPRGDPALQRDAASARRAGHDHCLSAGGRAAQLSGHVSCRGSAGQVVHGAAPSGLCADPAQLAARRHGGAGAGARLPAVGPV
jgi:hypothetical protein